MCSRDERRDGDVVTAGGVGHEGWHVDVPLGVRGCIEGVVVLGRTIAGNDPGVFARV